MAHIGTQLKDLEAENSLRGDLTADQQIALVSGTADLKEAVQGSCYLQECVPEDLDLKLKVWTSIDNLVTDKSMILASSTSCIVPSKISEGLKHRDQFIVAHPVNPPYFVPMVELVPGMLRKPCQQAMPQEKCNTTYQSSNNAKLSYQRFRPHNENGLRKII